MSSRLSDYDYTLPTELIATRPPAHREDARMLVLHRHEQRIEHRRFADFPEFIPPGDLVVLNNTRVVAARRFSDDAAIEFLFVERLGQGRWRCLAKPGRKVRVGRQFRVAGRLGRIEAIEANGQRVIAFEKEWEPHQGGLLPLPPYMARQSDSDDEVRYQTVFAQVPGALAAPTAGLHFTPEILARLPHVFITLHVGPGTFRPVRVEDVSEHQMLSECFAVSSQAAEQINRAKRVVAVGTTTVRVLESARRVDGQIVEQTGETDIFIYPPYQFHGVDSLLTNFHLPRSTLLMLVSALAGREFILAAYAEAIRERYRFFSYGDCMLIL